MAICRTLLCLALRHLCRCKNPYRSPAAGIDWGSAPDPGMYRIQANGRQGRRLRGPQPAVPYAAAAALGSLPRIGPLSATAEAVCRGCRWPQSVISWGFGGKAPMLFVCKGDGEPQVVTPTQSDRSSPSDDGLGLGSAATGPFWFRPFLQPTMPRAGLRSRQSRCT